MEEAKLLIEWIPSLSLVQILVQPWLIALFVISIFERCFSVFEVTSVDESSELQNGILAVRSRSYELLSSRYLIFMDCLGTSVGFFPAISCIMPAWT